MVQTAFQLAFRDKPVEIDFYGDIVSLQVEENTSIANTLRLKLAARLNDQGIWVYLDDTRFALFTKVSFKLGFVGDGGLAGALGSLGSALGGGNAPLVPVFDGYVTSFDFDVSSEPGASAIEIGAMDTSVLMSLEEKITMWKDKSDSAIVQEIVAKYVGVGGVQADPTLTVHQENVTPIVQRGTDIQFVRELAQRNGMEFYFETDQNTGTVTAYFRAPQLDDTPQPDLAVQSGDSSNLKSFAAHLTGQRPLAVKVAQMDVTQNTPNSRRISDSLLSTLGASDANTLIASPLGALVTPADAQAQMLVLGRPTSDATEMQTIAQAVRDEASWFISARGEINSEAYQTVLRPHRTVLISGAGKAYSGKYHVTRVVHELTGDGTYLQSFEARRNARDVDGSEQFGGGSSGLPIPGF
jgi:phage protein D